MAKRAPSAWRSSSSDATKNRTTKPSCSARPSRRRMRSCLSIMALTFRSNSGLFHEAASMGRRRWTRWPDRHQRLR
jgi:hypothetical protein